MTRIAAAARKPTGSITGFVGMRIQPCYETYPSQSSRDRRIGLSAIGNASRISTTPSRLPSPRISLHSSSNSKHRNGDTAAPIPSSDPIYRAQHLISY
jgi:hypothetical protein